MRGVRQRRREGDFLEIVSHVVVQLPADDPQLHPATGIPSNSDRVEIGEARDSRRGQGIEIISGKETEGRFDLEAAMCRTGAARTAKRDPRRADSRKKGEHHHRPPQGQQNAVYNWAF